MYTSTTKATTPSTTTAANNKNDIAHGHLSLSCRPHGSRGPCYLLATRLQRSDEVLSPHGEPPRTFLPRHWVNRGELPLARSRHELSYGLKCKIPLMEVPGTQDRRLNVRSSYDIIGIIALILLVLIFLRVFGII